MGNVMINSERLCLRPLSLLELESVSNDSAISKNHFIESDVLTTDIKSAISKKIKKMKYIDSSLHIVYTYWLICDKSTQKGIGVIGFKGALNQNGYIEIGYSISSNYRRKGLMTEALNNIIIWIQSFDELPNLNGVIANVLNSNIGSMRVLNNCQFEKIESNEKETLFLFKL